MAIRRRSRTIISINCLFVCFCLIKPSSANNFVELIEKIKITDPNSTIIKLSDDPESPYFAVKSISKQSPSKGIAIIVHDQGEHADWPEVIHPLRTLLPRFGWSTLSLQFPDLKSANTTNDIDPLNSLQNYIAQLTLLIKSEQSKNIVFITRGSNTSRLLNALPKTFDNLVAYISISSAGDPGNSEQSLASSLVKLNMAVLDIYAQRDYIAVTHTAKLRLDEVKQLSQNQQNNDLFKYQQVKVTAADHSFIGQEANLAKRIASWLHQNTPNKTTARPAK